MKHAFLLSTAAAACMAFAAVVSAQPSNQRDSGAPQGQHSDRQPKASPSVATSGRGDSARRGPQTAAQGVPSGRSWTGAPMRGPVTGAATAQSRHAPRYVAQSAPTYAPARNYGSNRGVQTSTPTYARARDDASHRNVQASQRFNAGLYRPPMGYVSRNWNYGQRLPAAYYARGYWINDYLLYALYGPPSGFVWVRVGDDALLINRYTGEIVAVETGVFY
jgi:Ni/Co efflux regulator RcnB